MRRTANERQRKEEKGQMLTCIFLIKNLFVGFSGLGRIKYPVAKVFVPATPRPVPPYIINELKIQK